MTMPDPGEATGRCASSGLGVLGRARSGDWLCCTLPWCCTRAPAETASPAAVSRRGSTAGWTPDRACCSMLNGCGTAACCKLLSTAVSANAEAAGCRSCNDRSGCGAVACTVAPAPRMRLADAAEGSTAGWPQVPADGEITAAGSVTAAGVGACCNWAC